MIVVPDIQFNMVIRVSCLVLRDLNLTVCLKIKQFLGLLNSSPEVVS